MEKEDSPAYELLYHTWKHANNAPIFSWERLNRSMHGAVILAIDSGMRFDKDDFSKISKDFRMGYWADGEGIYSQAVKSGNISACQALETWFNRKPFIAKFPVDLRTYGIGRDALRKEGRIAVGTRFRWDGEYVRVTSFANDGKSLTACAYKPLGRENTEQVIDKIQARGSKKFCPILKRYRISRKELNAKK